jgi:hypothetical protein
MAVRNDDEIELSQVNPQRFNVVLEDRGVVSRIEKDALVTVFDERGKAPIPCYVLGIRESVVQDGNAIFGNRRKRVRNEKCKKGK